MVKFQCLLRRKTAESDLTRSTCTKGLYALTNCDIDLAVQTKVRVTLSGLNVESLGLADSTSTQLVIAVQMHNNIVYKYILWH